MGTLQKRNADKGNMATEIYFLIIDVDNLKNVEIKLKRGEEVTTSIVIIGIYISMDL